MHARHNIYYCDNILIVAGASTSSAESFVANSHHPVSQADMTDPMADFLGGHQNMTENDKIIKVSANVRE